MRQRIGRTVGRPERPLDGRAGPLQEFAGQLRLLRVRGGNRSYRQMARAANFGAATLAKAASGSRLPSWDVTRAYVLACGGDLQEWRKRWEDVAHRLSSGSGDVQPIVADGQPTAGSAPVAGIPAQGAGTGPVPAQLPLDVPDFTGRATELARLRSLLPAESTRRSTQQGEGAMVIASIGGPAGIGKTALAVRFARQVAHRFPDGQLYVNLRGFDPSGDPLGPGEVLRSFLGALGMAPDLIPADVHEQAALFRSLLTGRAVLMLLDNARDAAQVRPLLPASPGCLVIVTSRSQLSGLIAREGVRPLTLGVLTQDEAMALLAARVGRQRIDAGPAAAGDLIGLCAGLPLALVIVAARAALCPGLPLAVLVGELRQARSLLDSLATGDAATDLRAVFSWSYEQLPEPAGCMFRLLGLHPGPDITAPAAASLAAIGPADAQVLLRELTMANLLIEHVPGRFTFHDLLRVYAADLATAPDPPHDPRVALGQLFDHYLSTAAAAMDLLHPAERNRRPRIASSAMAPASPEAALAWLDAELPCLVAVIAHAATRGWPQHAILLSATVERYLESGHHHEGLIVHGHARHAATQAGDHDAEAGAMRALGALRWRIGPHWEAFDHLQNALALYQRTGNQLGQARCLLVLGSMEAGQGGYSPAVQHLQQSLALFRHVGDGAGEAAALNNLADTLQYTGDSGQAIEYLRQALVVCRQVGDRNTEAHALQTLGEVEQRCGQLEVAAEHYQQALAVFRKIGHLRGEAWNMANLGTIWNLLGRPEQAAEHHQRAIALSRRIGDGIGEGVALNGLGEDAYAVGRIAEALTHHTAALSLLASTQNLEQQARAHIGIGHAHDALGQVDRAREHFQHAFNLHADLGRPESEQIHARLSGPEQAPAS